ncbi:pyranose 2-oxidase [Pluteus cervinus]|uniref:Pyranose 2-oxidase n=1 Tax=Pluteus cervinus TaxID=181527 RepID=A0ACD3A9Q7_9AGAR|nr:pyranose 2-oxidase [Pluteus cervinus]
MSIRLTPDAVYERLTSGTPNGAGLEVPLYDYDVVIAGSGPIGCAYARTILEDPTIPDARVLMVEIGSQDSSVIGEHHKNSIKFQKDIDAFVNVIKAALQDVSVPPGDTYIPTLVGNGWTPPVNNGTQLIFQGSNPNQIRELNLKASAVTRTVGGMATHWTCACPTPHPEEIRNNPIPQAERDSLFQRARELLNVHNDQYEFSMRHTTVKDTLLETLPAGRNVQSLPLAVERRSDNPAYVTWSGSNTVLGDVASYGDRFKLLSETRFTKLILDNDTPNLIQGALLRDLGNDRDVLAQAKAYVIATGAVGTPQVLANSGIYPDTLGRNLCEQSLAFCQVVMTPEMIDSITNSTNADWQRRIAIHKASHPTDPLPIPFNDPEPQVMIPYTTDFPWHCQVHRDAFSYGDVGPRADARVVVDLRFFGKQEINPNNRVYFPQNLARDWIPGNTDIYGMPQATFEVQRSHLDSVNDQKMMRDLCAVADELGAYLPGSNPQFMDPGLALHITGTTRIGDDPTTSVADRSSRVHGFTNLFVGGNGCIPDSTSSNPTLTSVMIALKACEAVSELLRQPTTA